MNATIGFDPRLMVLSTHPLSFWKRMLKEIPPDKRRMYFCWRFREFAQLENLPKTLLGWDTAYHYIKVIIEKRLTGMDGEGI
jgi:hypothetical protein